jgi:anti-sigma factor RsiW
MPADITHAWVLDRLSAYIDGELDAGEALDIAAHLASCAACSADYNQLLKTVDSMHQLMPPLRAPDELRARITASVRAAGAPRTETARPIRSSRQSRPWLMAAAVLVMIGAAYALGARTSAQPSASLADAALSAHVRSLQQGHLTDVASTDQHTVKPWFTGKLDFSPVVARLESEGFPLVGGRVDYVADHPAAALVYKRRAHVINVLTYPSATKATVAPRMETQRGYQIASWSAGGMDYWVVTDLNADELRTFCTLIREAAAQ